MTAMFAIISGDQAIGFILWLVLGAIVFGALQYLISYAAPAEPLGKFLRWGLAAIAAVVLIVFAQRWLF